MLVLYVHYSLNLKPRNIIFIKQSQKFVGGQKIPECSTFNYA